MQIKTVLGGNACRNRDLYLHFSEMPLIYIINIHNLKNIKVNLNLKCNAYHNNCVVKILYYLSQPNKCEILKNSFSTICYDDDVICNIINEIIKFKIKTYYKCS